jgi:putative flippase GtrA
VNTAGLLVTLIPLYVSRNVLGYDSLLADNISANLIGVALAAAFRFLANRIWVFTKA